MPAPISPIEMMPIVATGAVIFPLFLLKGSGLSKAAVLRARLLDIGRMLFLASVPQTC